jgi:cytochrome c peroxidase
MRAYVRRWTWVIGLGVGFASILSLMTLQDASAQIGPMPLPPNLADYVKDENWARILGKALFWDQKAGSDGMACASCHFAAGADPRDRNQITPGFNQLPVVPDIDVEIRDDGVGPLAGDLTFERFLGGPNAVLRKNRFPTHRLSNPDDRNSNIIRTTNDKISSSGAFAQAFEQVIKDTSDEECGGPVGEVFHTATGAAARQVEPLHSPTTVNAGFFRRLFWNSRANNVFNGKGVFGWRDIDNDPTARILVRGDDNQVALEVAALPDGALASQAVAPPVSALEMSCNGRTFADVGRKLLGSTGLPLEDQIVHERDSLLGVDGPKGNLRDAEGGLKIKYEDLIKHAFHDRLWDADGNFIIEQTGANSARVQRAGDDPNAYTMMEHNFSLFWGVSIMLYEATLVSDQSRFDTANAAVGGCLQAGGDAGAQCVQDAVGARLLTEQEGDGIILFHSAGTPPNQDGSLGEVGGNCNACHVGPLFTGAAAPVDGLVFKAALVPQFDPVTDTVICTAHDFSFFGIGTRPVDHDIVMGGEDPYGNPLSFGRQYWNWLEAGKPDPDGAAGRKILVDRFNPADFNFDDPAAGGTTINICGPDLPLVALKVDHSVKTPGLRNVALTPPYFSHGGDANLATVVDFYARGGNKRDRGPTGDDTGTGADGNTPPDQLPLAQPPFGTNVDDGMRRLNLALDPAVGKDQQYGKDAIIAFMKTLTDPRVQCDEAPFDHPSLEIFNGHDADGDDIVFELPAVGADGYEPDHPELCIPNAGDFFAPGMRARVGG